jgi:hypothetical protein
MFSWATEGWLSYRIFLFSLIIADSKFEDYGKKAHDYLLAARLGEPE